MRTLLLLLTFSISAPAFAQSQQMDIRPYAERIVGEALLDSFSGKTHDGAYNFSGEGVPRDNYVELHNTDGTVVYEEGGERSGGVWMVRDDQLCFLYPEMNGGCFRVWKVGTCYYYYSDLLPEREDEVDRDYWTARSVPQGEDATCEAILS